MNRYTRSALCTSILCICALTGCTPGVVEVTEVLNYQSCKTIQSGAKWVDFEQLAELRGAVITEETLALPKGLHLLAVSKGTQPTAGYAFGLLNSDADRRALNIRLSWQQPTSGMHAQTLTSPCIVIGISTEAVVQKVVVLVNELPFTELAFPDGQSAASGQ
ncbi:MAG: hypothetical protein ACI9ON_000645 [Limisphaerales bacterium]